MTCGHSELNLGDLTDKIYRSVLGAAEEKVVSS